MTGYRALSLQGDHFSMGLQHGRQVLSMRPLIVAAMDTRQRQIEQDGPDTHFEALIQETGELLLNMDTALIAMIRGQAEALELKFDDLLLYGLASYLRDYLLTRQTGNAEGCTTWAAGGAATADGEPILAKNRDYRLEHLPLQVVVRARPERGFSYVYSSSAGSPGVFCAGINRAGLAVADTHVSSTDLGPGLPDYALMMHLLQNHDTVLSALDYLRSVPRLGRNNLVLTDLQGDMVVFEIGHRQCGVSQVRDGILVNTNHFVSLELQSSYVEVEASQTRGNSQQRYEMVTNTLNAARGRIDIELAQSLMSSHAGLLASICRHPMDDNETATISSSIFLPARRQMWFCHGLPCQGRYDVFDLG